ncbi:MAG: hypothetical protein ACLFVI_06700 [Archaeoglobaceae archaeon]
MRGVIVAVLIILVSVLALFASINTVTIFTGSHYLTDISSSQNDIDCTWCHSWMRDELNGSAIHSGFKCEECHRIKITTSGEVIEYATHNESGIYPGNQSHAAYTPTCLDCHGGNGIYYNDTTKAKQAPPAPAFNQTDYGSDHSAHKSLVVDAKSQGMSFGENEACISCHSKYTIWYEYVRPEYYNFTIKDDWKVWPINYGPDNTTKISKPEKGAKHELKALDEITCETCHSDVWQAINHTEDNTLGNAPNSSHAIWWWGNYSDPMHDPRFVGSSYDNKSDYCLSSCHEPTVINGTPPQALTDQVHTARRLSCYHCHSGTTNVNVENKPGSDTEPAWNSSIHGNFATEEKVFSSPLFLHAETCIACKRAGSPYPDPNVQYKTWTEPSNKMYDVNNGHYI